MKRKLGGWQRLWVSLSVVYLFFVVVWTGVEFPSKVALSDAEIQSQLSEAHRAEVGGLGPRFLPFQEITLSNGDRIEVLANLTASEKEELERRIRDLYVDKLRKQRLAFLGSAILAWALPTAGLYYIVNFLSRWVRWVYHGFKGK